MVGTGASTSRPASSRVGSTASAPACSCPSNQNPCRAGGVFEPHPPYLQLSTFNFPTFNFVEIFVMKRYFLSLIGLALMGAGSALAQQPIVQTNAPGSAIANTTQFPVTGHLFNGGRCDGLTCVPECYMKQK